MERDEPEDVWRITVLTDGDILRMPKIGIEIPVSEIYDGLSFPDEDSD